MWLFTPIGFFSIVCKPGDAQAGTLTLRSRVRADLENLRAHHLPELGPISESLDTDYRFRAQAPREAVAQAMAAAVHALDYGNFKSEVAKRQGSARAHRYGKVWSELHDLQGQPEFETTVPVTVSAKGQATKKTAGISRKSSAVPKATAYGGVLFDDQGRVLLREPSGHFGGYAWTWPKGRPDAGETPEQAALREVKEETGYSARIIGLVPGVFGGTTSTTVFFLMKPEGSPVAFTDETAAICWATDQEAQALIVTTPSATGRQRDLDVLAAAKKAFLALDHSDRD